VHGYADNTDPKPNPKKDGSGNDKSGDTREHEGQETIEKSLDPTNETSGWSKKHSVYITHTMHDDYPLFGSWGLIASAKE